MSDLIDRQAAIEALLAWEEDSVWDEECIKHRGEPYWVAPSDVIEQLPSAQPEIIRCKDCKKAPKCYGDVVMRTKSGGNKYCPLTYCSEAERKTDDVDVNA